MGLSLTGVASEASLGAVTAVSHPLDFLDFGTGLNESGRTGAVARDPPIAAGTDRAVRGTVWQAILLGLSATLRCTDDNADPSFDYG